MDGPTPSQKGAIAEAAVAAAAVRHGLGVLLPTTEGLRYDIAIDLGASLIRVQCKWASLRDGVVTASIETCRHTPHGYLRTTYTAEEIDAIAVFCPATDVCYLIPIRLAEARSWLSLRIAPTRNNQAEGVRWARDFEFATSLRSHWALDARPLVTTHRAAEPASIAF